MSSAYYNEQDPKAAAWLRELIKHGHIAPGEVDERDIQDVCPDDLAGFRQHHFFAGIGGWSYALRLAGWPDDKPVWTGSCPCQPFSAAGKRKGTADERHLWPAWHWLIRESRPHVIFGEQVASKDGISWLDTVSTDLEGEGYAVAPVVFPACGVGAPEMRARTWFVAEFSEFKRIGRRSGEEIHRPEEIERPTRLRDASGLGDSDGTRSGWYARSIPGTESEIRVINGHLADVIKSSGATRGFWEQAEWIIGRDGKVRAIEPGSFPLAHGAPARVGRLRGYGNAIVAPCAAEVIAAYMESP